MWNTIKVLILLVCSLAMDILTEQVSTWVTVLPGNCPMTDSYHKHWTDNDDPRGPGPRLGVLCTTMIHVVRVFIYINHVSSMHVP